jgi:hypothetical protein
MKKSLTVLMCVAIAAGMLLAPIGTAGAKKGATVVGKDAAGDFNMADDPALSPIGDVLGADIVEASIQRAGADLNFIIKMNQLQTVPEFVRYIWGIEVDGNYAELDGKFTNYSRGACDPTSGQCPPPRDPGMQPFIVRANCTTDTTASLTTCEEVGVVQAIFDTAEGTVTIPVPMAMIKAKPGSKITAGLSDFSGQSGGNVLAIASAFVSRSDFPRDAMNTTKTYKVPK